MASIKLFYFNSRGRAEVLRLLLVASGVEWEDIRFSWEEWSKFQPAGDIITLHIGLQAYKQCVLAGFTHFQNSVLCPVYRVELDAMVPEETKEIKDAPFGQAPYLQYNGKTMSQGIAIANFLAKEFGFYGNSNLDALRIDEVIYLIQDLINCELKVYFEKDETKKAELLQKLKTEDIPKFLGFFQKLLKESGTGYFVGDKMTVADLAVYDRIVSMKEMWKIADVHEGYPELKELCNSRTYTNAPFGQAPYLVYNGKTVSQSVAIANFLAREFGFYGKSNLDALRIDEVICLVQDLVNCERKVYFEKDEVKRAELLEKLKTEDIPKFFGFFQKLLKESGTGYFVGDKMTVADLAVYDRIISMQEMWKIAHVDEGYPELQELHKRVEEHPNIHKYIEEHKAKVEA